MSADRPKDPCGSEVPKVIKADRYDGDGRTLKRIALCFLPCLYHLSNFDHPDDANDVM